MVKRSWIRSASLGAAVIVCALLIGSPPVRADGTLQHVKHIIIVMQENRSFDNYFGVLPFVPNTPYHSAKGRRRRACAASDHTCVDGLSCKMKRGTLVCSNVNRSNTHGAVRSFHDPRYCMGLDLTHGWVASHRQGNFSHPNNMLRSSPNRGFVRVDAQANPADQATDHDTMGYYTDADLPFYYGLAESFAISDRYFAAVIGPTFPNRAYFLAGTSFGHLSTSETITGGGYKPRLSYVIAGAPREALLAPESHCPGCERRRSRGHVRLRQLAVRECSDRHRTTADAARGSQLPLRWIAWRRPCGWRRLEHPSRLPRGGSARSDLPCGIDHRVAELPQEAPVVEVPPRVEVVPMVGGDGAPATPQHPAAPEDETDEVPPRVEVLRRAGAGEDAV
jgi:hypothetical protein